MDSRTQKMAEVIVNYSLAVKPGEVCLFRGTSPLAQPLMRALTAEALKAGGVPFNYVHMSGEGVVLLEHGAVAQIERLNPMLKLMYETASCIVRIEAEEETGALVAFPPEKQQAYMRSKGGIINIQMDREAARTLRRCTTLYPTPAYARDAGMSETDYENFVFGACMVAEPDPLRFWHELSAMQDKLITWLRGKKAFHVQGKNIDLTFSAEGRLWENANGKFNFPDGEIFTGPVENSVNGWVRFTYPAIREGRIVDGVELRFEQGKVVHATAKKNEEYLLTQLASDPGAKYLGEWAIGTNFGIQRFTGNILFDEKIGGTIHMALGRGYPETGSVNESSIHWDMICDMRNGSEIVVDGELFYKNGQFTF